MTLQLVLSPEQRRLLTDGVHKAHLRCVCALCGVCVCTVWCVCVHCVIVVCVCICGVCVHCVLALSKFKYSESVTVNRLSCALPSSDCSNRVTTKTCVYINLNVGMCALCGVGLLCGPPLWPSLQVLLPWHQDTSEGHLPFWAESHSQRHQDGHWGVSS